MHYDLDLPNRDQKQQWNETTMFTLKLCAHFKLMSSGKKRELMCVFCLVFSILPLKLLQKKTAQWNYVIRSSSEISKHLNFGLFSC